MADLEGVDVTDRTCIIDGCERGFYARGWCKMHYLRAWLAGSHTERPRELVAQGASLDERLRHIGWTTTPAGCWEWAGSLNGGGYGQLAVGTDRPMIASRAAHVAWIGPIPDGQFVCHRCDNRRCINPAHLYAGTVQDNVGDAVARERVANGERHGAHRLTDAQIAELRARYAAGGVTQRRLAAEYGICQQQVSLVIRRKRRRDATYRGHLLPDAQVAAAMATDAALERLGIEA